MFDVAFRGLVARTLCRDSVSLFRSFSEKSYHDVLFNKLCLNHYRTSQRKVFTSTNYPLEFLHNCLSVQCLIISGTERPNSFSRTGSRVLEHSTFDVFQCLRHTHITHKSASQAISYYNLLLYVAIKHIRERRQRIEMALRYAEQSRCTSHQTGP